MKALSFIPLTLVIIIASIISTAVADDTTEFTVRVRSIIDEKVTEFLVNCDDHNKSTHPCAMEVCQELEDSQGQIGEASSQACTREYFPLSLTLDGVFKGSPLKYDQVQPNPCMLRDQTSTVPHLLRCDGISS